MNTLQGRSKYALRQIWRNRIATVLALAIPLIIVTMALLLVQQVRTSDAVRAAEQESQETRAALLLILSAHQDIETGSRGFVITGDPAFLEPYNSGTRQLDKIFGDLGKLYANQPADLAVLDRMRQLSAARRAASADNIAARRAGGFDAAAAVVASGKGKRLMDQLRQNVRVLLDRENARIAETTSRSGKLIVDLRNLTFGLLGSLTVLLILAGLAINRTLQARDIALAAEEDQSLRRALIFETTMDGIVMLNPSGTIEDINSATLEMFGYAIDDLRRRDVGILFASQPPIGRAAETLREMGIDKPSAGVTMEILGRRADGTEFPTEVAISSTTLNQGLRYVAIIRDVTERKRVEQIKSEFVSTVSHELRTPLTSIAGSLGLLTGGAAGALSDRAERLIGIAQNNASRLVRLINDILDIEKIESGKMRFENRELDLRDAINAVAEESRGYATGFGVTISQSSLMTPMIVSADPDRLAQVFTNLISNACKFSPQGGIVEVSLGQHGRSYRVTIADHGPGIPEEFRGRIFGKFAQADSSDSREKGGTGLGLSIVREIIKRLDGRVSYESEPGKGTRFHVDLPAVIKPVRAGKAPFTPAVLVCGNGAGSSFTAALREAGYDVTFVARSDDARAALEQRTFSGAVVDMGLPQGLGIELIRMIRESRLNRDTPTLAIGGRTGGSELEGDAAEVLDWLRKPVEVRRLVDRVEAARARSTSGIAKVLHVEDDPDVVRLIAEALEGRADVDSAEGVEAAREMLAAARYDLVILDLSLADGNGVELLAELKGDGLPGVPVIVFSAQDADPATAGRVDAFLTKARTPIGALVALVGTLVSTERDPKQP